MNLDWEEMSLESNLTISNVIEKGISCFLNMFFFPASPICNEFNLGIFFVSYGLDLTSTVEHVADTFRFHFF